MSEERFEDRMARENGDGYADELERERSRVPRMRELLRDMYLSYLVGASNDAAEAHALALVARHLHQLPDSDLRFRVLEGFLDFDVLSVIEDYAKILAQFGDVAWVATGPFFDMHGLPTKANVDKLVTLLLLEAVAFDAGHADTRLTQDERQRVFPRRSTDGYSSISPEDRAELMRKIRAFPTRSGEVVDLVTLLGSDPQLVAVVMSKLVERREDLGKHLAHGSEAVSRPAEQTD